jgi:RNA polymerase sigma factor (sigma-70 family)
LILFADPMKEESRNGLWAKFLNGDNDALSSLYKEFAHDMYSYGMKISKDENLVKDSIQDVFIQMINKRKNLTASSEIHFYLFKSLRNKIIEVLRTENRRHNIVSGLAGEENFEQNAEQAIIESEEVKSIRKIISSAISNLPNRQSEIIYLKYTEGLNYEEIARLLEIDIASARTLLYRSLKTIKDHLGKNIIILVAIFCSSLHPRSIRK